MQNGITAFEKKRLQDLDVKISIRKERAHNSSSGMPAQYVVAPVPASSGCVRTLEVAEVVIAQRCSPTKELTVGSS